MDTFSLSGPKRSAGRTFVIAWALGCCFYFLEYVVRASPAVMIPELSGGLGVTTLEMSSILGAYYYTYSVTSLVAGVALDHAGARYPVSIGMGILGLGCLLFALHAYLPAETGRLLQGAGSAFAFTGCVYLASHGFSPRSMATAIGLTQCIGMLGGSAGQFVVGPLIKGGLSPSGFWLILGTICAIIAVLLFLIIPKETPTAFHGSPAASMLIPYRIVFSNVQSWLTGVVSGLLFAPTTLFAMTWGIAFFQQDRRFTYSSAVLTCSMTAAGWVIGCPLLGWISDRMGRRKPALAGGITVMMACLAQLSFWPQLAPAPFTMLLLGIASGAAMIPYSVIKEANPDTVKGSATGGQNFLTFGVTALIGPWFAHLYGKTLTHTPDPGQHFQRAGTFFLLGAAIALLLSLGIRETGHAITKRPL